MSISSSPTQSDVFTTLRSFILKVINTPGFEAVEGQQNRVSTPKNPDYCVFTPTGFRRLATNLDQFYDCKFVASIAGPTMTVTAVDYGALVVDRAVFGVNVADGSVIKALGTVNPDGTGTYTISPSQTVASEVMACGTETVTQNVNLCVQIDFHGPASSDNAAIFCTLFRDSYAVDFFSSAASSTVPLHADDPKQIPFINDQDQYEDRWIVEAYMQVDKSVVNIPQEFFETATVGLIDVDSNYPP